MVKVSENLIRNIGKENYAGHAGRCTVKKEDVKLGLKD